MRLKYAGLICAAVFILLAISSPGRVEATSIAFEVNPKDPTCSPTTSSPPCFTTIQAAINEAVLSAQTFTTNSYSVLVEPGNYGEAITLASGIPVQGRETAGTTLSGGGTGTVVTASNVNNVSLRNFTVINAAVGILVSNSAGVNINNNVFQAGTAGTAVQIQNSPTTNIVNNVFYQNGTAISRDADIVIKNNIFSTNTLAINLPSAFTLISYNDFFLNTSDGPTGSNAITATTPTPLGVDPLFVNPGLLDFHLRENSPCIDTGDPSILDTNIDDSRSDIGAYGGPYMDTIPFRVSQPSATQESSNSISISWNPNNSYLVTNTTNPGSYNVYYSFGVSGPPYQNKVNIISTATSTVISGLTSTVAAPPAPFLYPPSPLNDALQLSWTASAGASGYKVHYGIASPDENTVDVKNVTGYTLRGLTNGQTYQIAVSAYTLATYFFSVTAVDNTGKTPTPGIAHESAYSLEAQVTVGSPAESANSNIVSDFPEAITAYPDLPNNGCFIATAAYGYYSAPQVQALRQFRDRYLLTNAVGTAFVKWYYRYGPIGAEFMNEHPWLKPVVRTALLPAVGGAMFMTRTSVTTKAMILVGIGLLIMSSILYGKKLRGLRPGGNQ